MQRVSTFSRLSLLLILLSVGCLGLSCYFETQYAHAHGVPSLASSIGLQGPETYKDRDRLAFTGSILVCVLAVVLAFRHKHWSDWLAVVVAALVTWAIQYNLQARL
jgi:hypothetical protein